MRARDMLVSMAAAGVLLSGCGPGTATTAGPASAANPLLHGTGPPQPVPGSAAGLARAIATRWAAAAAPAPNTSIEFRTIDYTATVFNPGTPGGFTAFITTRRTVLVTPASAATTDASNGAPPRFATPADQALWQAAGRPSLGQAATTGQRQTTPAGQFSFIPQGSTLTYRQAAALPAEPDRLAAAILDHLRPYAGTHPPASLELKQLAYLIATAALTDAARSAAWQVVATLPGLRDCQTSGGPRNRTVRRLRRRRDPGQRRSRHRGDPHDRRPAAAALADVPARSRRHDSRVEHLPRRLTGNGPSPSARAMPGLVLRIQRIEAVGVEVLDHIADPVRAGERHLGDPRHGHALRGQQHHLGPPPGHHRPRAPPHDPQQPAALVIVDLPNLNPVSHAGRCALNALIGPGTRSARRGQQG